MKDHEQSDEQIIEIDEDGKVHGDISGLKPQSQAMTPQQAGVSALLHGDQVREMSELAKSEPFLSGKFQYDYWDNFAAGLNTLLATAPPEQGAQTSEQLRDELQRVYKLVNYWHGEAQRLERELAEKPDPPQAASAGALSAEQVREALNSADSQEWETPEEWAQHVADRLNAALAAHDQAQFDKGWQLAHELAKCGHPRACYQDSNWPKSEGDEKCIVCEALAAHDQKVGDQLAAWMIVNNFATGHGDTVEDLLKELKWQIEERIQRNKNSP